MFSFSFNGSIETKFIHGATFRTPEVTLTMLPLTYFRYMLTSCPGLALSTNEAGIIFPENITGGSFPTVISPPITLKLTPVKGESGPKLTTALYPVVLEIVVPCSCALGKDLTLYLKTP